MKNKKDKSFRNPWLFIPTLYFAEGVPYILINVVSVILYKKMGIDNAQIAFWTSLLYLPWVVKMFWSPFVDTYSTKRLWILATQLAMTACLGLIAFSLQIPYFFTLSLAAFILGAFISATHDIAADGFYLLALSQKDQAFFVGIRATFYRIAMIFGSGLLVYLAGCLEKSSGNIPLSWTMVFGISAAVFALLTLYHKLLLPFPAGDSSDQYSRDEERATPFIEVFTFYFKQKKLLAIIAFILFYRFGEAMLIKLATPFLLDEKSVGGMQLSTADIGLVYGTIGMIALIIGGILGGWLISRYGLKKCILPMVLILNIPNFAYLYMAYAQPPLLWAYPLVAIEQFGYGIGTAAFMVFLMYIAKGEYKTSHYAISTGLMALGMMLPGLASGYLQEAVGYQNFFTIVLLMGIPSIITIFFIPLEDSDKE